MKSVVAMTLVTLLGGISFAGTTQIGSASIVAAEVRAIGFSEKMTGIYGSVSRAGDRDFNEHCSDIVKITVAEDKQSLAIEEGWAGTPDNQVNSLDEAAKSIWTPGADQFSYKNACVTGIGQNIDDNSTDGCITSSTYSVEITNTYKDSMDFTDKHFKQVGLKTWDKDTLVITEGVGLNNIAANLITGGSTKATCSYKRLQ